MSRMARQVLRKKAKLKLKEMKKEKPEYKDVRFADFFKIYKAGLFFEHKPEEAPPQLEDNLNELESIILDDDIEEDDVEDSE